MGRFPRFVPVSAHPKGVCSICRDPLCGGRDEHYLPPSRGNS